MPWHKGSEKPESEGQYFTICGKSLRFYALRYWTRRGGWSACSEAQVIAWREIPAEPQWIEEAVQGARGAEWKERLANEKALKDQLNER